MVRRPARAALLVVAASVPLLASACGLIPPEIDCGPLVPAQCEQHVRVVAETQGGDPTRRIVRITFTDDRGSYSVEFDDGTGTMLIVD